MTEINLVENKELREQMAAQVEVLDKVKNLFLLPKLDMMTVQQVAAYYEVGEKSIQSCYARNCSEIDEDGTTKYSAKTLIERFLQDAEIVKTQYYRDIVLSDKVTLRVPNVGIRLFSKRAVLRIGMLLRDSEIAKEVRTQLLNAFEKTSNEQKVHDIETERSIVERIVLAFADGDITGVCEGSMKLNAFHKRHISALMDENSALQNSNRKQAAKIEADAQKVAYAEAAGSCKNTVSLSTYAKILYDEYGIRTGRNRLKAWMRRKGFLDGKGDPYQRYMEQGLFKTIFIPRRGNRNLGDTAVRLTAKGQQKLYPLIAADWKAGILNAERDNKL